MQIFTLEKEEGKGKKELVLILQMGKLWQLACSKSNIKVVTSTEATL